DEAKRITRQALVHYDLGEWDKAIAEFKRAYEISEAPTLLFNLAQAHRKKKEYAEALKLYESYLRRLPGARNRALVERFQAESRRELEKEKAAAMPPPTPVEPPAPVVVAPRAPE